MIIAIQLVIRASILCVYPMSKLVTSDPPMETAAEVMMSMSYLLSCFFSVSRAIQRKKRRGTEICHSTYIVWYKLGRQVAYCIVYYSVLDGKVAR
jgi:hypothetical protein